MGLRRRKFGRRATKKAINADDRWFGMAKSIAHRFLGNAQEFLLNRGRQAVFGDTSRKKITAQSPGNIGPHAVARLIRLAVPALAAVAIAAVLTGPAHALAQRAADGIIAGFGSRLALTDSRGGLA